MESEVGLKCSTNTSTNMVRIRQKFIRCAAHRTFAGCLRSLESVSGRSHGFISLVNCKFSFADNRPILHVNITSPTAHALVPRATCCLKFQIEVYELFIRHMQIAVHNALRSSFRCHYCCLLLRVPFPSRLKVDSSSELFFILHAEAHYFFAFGKCDFRLRPQG